MSIDPCFSSLSLSGKSKSRVFLPASAILQKGFPYVGQYTKQP